MRDVVAIVFAMILAANCFAGQDAQPAPPSLEMPAQVVPIEERKADAPPAQVIVLDPIFAVIDQFRQPPQNSAVVVEIGPEGAFIGAANLKWRVPKEESGPAAAKARREARPDDPEEGRVSPFAAPAANVALADGPSPVPPAPEDIDNKAEVVSAKPQVKDARAARVLDAIAGNVPFGVLNGRVYDQLTGEPAGARVLITDQTETAVASPLPTGFWTRGEYKVRLLAGATKIEISRGRFFPPFMKSIEILPNQNNTYEEVIGRPGVLNFPARGWFLADFDISLAARPGEQRAWVGDAPTLENLIVAARAENVNIIGVQIPDGTEEELAEFFRAAAASSEVLVLPIFSRAQHFAFGTAMGIGLSSKPETGQELAKLDSPLRDAFEEFRLLGGISVYKNFRGSKRIDIAREMLTLQPNLRSAPFFSNPEGHLRLYGAGELPFDTVCGNVYDAIAFDGTSDAEALWFNLLNNGYTTGIIGAGGGSFEAGYVPFGQTFVNVEGARTRENALNAIRAGKTVVSFGPAVFSKILERDKGPGSTLPADGRPLTLQVQAYASMQKGCQLGRIELLRNGEVINSIDTVEGEAQVNDLRWQVSEANNAWYVVRVTEKKTSGQNVEIRRAWTSPVYFRNAAFGAPDPAVSRITGVLKRGLTPTTGTVTAISPGQEDKMVATDNQGNYSINASASAVLVFYAEGCEPAARRIFDHPAVQKGLRSVHGNGSIMENLKNPAVFNSWKLLLAELKFDVSLTPVVDVIK